MPIGIGERTLAGLLATTRVCVTLFQVAAGGALGGSLHHRRWLCLTLSAPRGRGAGLSRDCGAWRVACPKRPGGPDNVFQRDQDFEPGP